jgi:TRAP-type mannitol/chloroaromatic compound transport system substrate-binding protein
VGGAALDRGGIGDFKTQIKKGGNIMKRREFLKTAGAGLAASTAVAAPAIAQSMPGLKWRCSTSWPKSLDVPFSAETISEYVAEATDNKF